MTFAGVTGLGELSFALASPVSQGPFYWDLLLQPSGDAITNQQYTDNQ